VVAISLLTLVPGEVGGSETYARGLTRGLAQAGTLPCTAYAPPVAADAGGGLPTIVVAAYGRARSLPRRALAMAHAGARPVRLRQAYAGAAAVHYPLTVPLPSLELPTAVTLHDVLHLDLPALVPRAERLLRRLTYDRAARQASLVIVPSSFTRDRAVDLLRLDPACVRVVAHGIDHDRFRPGDDEREPFVLYPARAWPHKNHAHLLDAFALVRRERPELRLVLTGGGHERRAYPDGVEARGLVSLDELASLYRRASALVFPSRYEGWGAPPLEAMASGCPVAAARAGSLPEICGEAARLFDPDSAGEIAAATLDVLATQDEWRRRGLERAASFTWAQSARDHETVYRELLGETQ
jgi:glycosyltransferase involved in cell wall biosynthesis